MQVDHFNLQESNFLRNCEEILSPNSILNVQQIMTEYTNICGYLLYCVQYIFLIANVKCVGKYTWVISVRRKWRFREEILKVTYLLSLFALHFLCLPSFLLLLWFQSTSSFCFHAVRLVESTPLALLTNSSYFPLDLATECNILDDDN